MSANWTSGKGGWKDFNKKDGKWKDYGAPKNGSNYAAGYGGSKSWKNPSQDAKNNPYLVCSSCDRWCYTNLAKKNDYKCKCGEAFACDEADGTTRTPPTRAALGGSQAAAEAGGNKPKAKTEATAEAERDLLTPLAGLLETLRQQVPASAMAEEMQAQMQQLFKWTAKAEAEKQAKNAKMQPTLAQALTARQRCTSIHASKTKQVEKHKIRIAELETEMAKAKDLLATSISETQDASTAFEVATKAAEELSNKTTAPPEEEEAGPQEDAEKAARDRELEAAEAMEQEAAKIAGSLREARKKRLEEEWELVQSRQAKKEAQKKANLDAARVAETAAAAEVARTAARDADMREAEVEAADEEQAADKETAEAEKLAKAQKDRSRSPKGKKAAEAAADKKKKAEEEKLAKGQSV